MDWIKGGARPIDFCPNRPFSNCLWVPQPTHEALALYDAYGAGGWLPYRVSPDLSALVRVKGSDSLGWEITSWVDAAVHLFREHLDDVRVSDFLRDATNPRLGINGNPPTVLGV